MRFWLRSSFVLARWETLSRLLPLAVDCGFALEGYVTDKTQLYWAGPEASIPDAVKRAHAFCMDVQAWTAEALRPGAAPSEIWEHCRAWAERDGFGEASAFMSSRPTRSAGMRPSKPSPATARICATASG